MIHKLVIPNKTKMYWGVAKPPGWNSRWFKLNQTSIKSQMNWLVLFYIWNVKVVLLFSYNKMSTLAQNEEFFILRGWTKKHWEDQICCLHYERLFSKYFQIFYTFLYITIFFPFDLPVSSCKPIFFSVMGYWILHHWVKLEHQYLLSREKLACG